MKKANIELRKRIRGKYLRIGDFAADLGITKGTLGLKLNGKSEWTRAEIEKVASVQQECIILLGVGQRCGKRLH